MTVEIGTYFSKHFAEREMREAGPAIEYPVRPHHFDTHVALVQNVISSNSQDIETICYTSADALTDKIETEDKWRSHHFRYTYGSYLEDDTVPINYRTDFNGSDRAKATQRFTQLFTEFFTRPDAAVTAVGPFIDHICRGCAFGGGQGGFHCKTYDIATEEKKTRTVEGYAKTYLESPAAKLVQNESPGQLWFYSEQVLLPQSFRVRPESDMTTVTQLTMPLQLYRNIVTETALRERQDARQGMTFQSLLAHKGIGVRR